MDLAMLAVAMFIGFIAGAACMALAVWSANHPPIPPKGDRP